MPKTKILPVHHTGRIRPHHHTSYGSLVLVLLMAVCLVLFVQQVVAADTTSGNGSEGVFAVVPATPIKNPAIITSPSNGRVYTTSDPVTVFGSCPPGSLIKIFKDEVMAGATLCQGGGFSLPISLFIGGNSLIARAYNANDIPGPDSTPVTVHLQPPGISLPPTGEFDPTQAPAGQFYLTTDVYYRGGQPGDTMNWQVTLVGGQAPYAISVNWGDGKSDLMSRTGAGPFNLSHIYKNTAGNNDTYTVTVKAGDQKGETTELQVFALVPRSHRATTVTATSGGTSLGTIIQTTWRTLTVVAIGIGSFWFGEKRVLFMLHHHIK